MATNENLLLRREEGLMGGGPVKAGEIIYSGTLVYVGADGFYSASAAGKFGGVSQNFYDNSGGVDGDVDAKVWERSSFVLNGNGFTQADVGKEVFGTDNNTVALSGTVRVGTITRVASATEVLVALDIQA